MLRLIEGMLAHVLLFPLDATVQWVSGGMLGLLVGLCWRRPRFTVVLQVVRGSGNNSGQRK